VFRYNEIWSSSSHYYNDGIGGGENFSTKGFPNSDSDVYGNRISQTYDDGIESEGQVSFLTRNDCQYGQGNYFSALIEAEAIGALMVKSGGQDTRRRRVTSRPRTAAKAG